jgi:hypothetical protein
MEAVERNSWFEVRKFQDGIEGGVWEFYDNIDDAREFTKSNPDPRPDIEWKIVEVKQTREIVE